MKGRRTERKVVKENVIKMLTHWKKKEKKKNKDFEVQQGGPLEVQNNKQLKETEVQRGGKQQELLQHQNNKQQQDQLVQ